MNLELVNDLFNNLKEKQFVKNFIKELSDYLKNKNDLNQENNENPIIEEILSKNNFTTGNQNSIRWKLSDVILKYSQKTLDNNEIYFVKDIKNNDTYRVLKTGNSKIEEVEISKKNLQVMII